ncbi:hypothetical protein VE03_00217 [Pseudogymnoascus sp. 23342-1-I1]|nr:hypothetical protein VE03_00217 [Pseudogymnoascus sp. 23342-1-I1]
MFRLAQDVSSLSKPSANGSFMIYCHFHSGYTKVGNSASSATAVMQHSRILGKAPQARTSATTSMALHGLQQIRKPRSTMIQVKSRMHQDILHVEDGKFQAERDKKMEKDSEDSPLFWGSLDRRKWLFSYDPDLATDIANPDYLATSVI